MDTIKFRATIVCNARHLIRLAKLKINSIIIHLDYVLTVTVLGKIPKDELTFWWAKNEPCHLKQK